jgi:energy-coupling factor transport system permease protein
MRAALGRYYDVASPIHALDPRMKIHLLILLVIGSFVAHSFIGLAILLVVALAAIVCSRVPAGFVLRTIAPFVVVFAIPLVFSLFFSTGGDVLLHWGVITLTSGGLYRALFATMRLVVLFLFVTVFTLTTSSIRICDATDYLLAPFTRFGFPSHEIALVMSIALRFIPLLQEEFIAIRKAQLSRGARFDEGGPVRRLSGVFPLVVPLFTSALRHAEGLAYAMESRCYIGCGHRTCYRELRMRPADWLALALIVIADVLVCFL